MTYSFEVYDFGLAIDRIKWKLFIEIETFEARTRTVEMSKEMMLRGVSVAVAVKISANTEPKKKKKKNNLDAVSNTTNSV